MKKNRLGFTLIELLMVIAVIGILSALAIPVYRGHIVMAKLSEVENGMSAVASGVAAYYQDQDAWPSCPTVNEVRNSLGVSLGSLTRILAISVSGVDGEITVTVGNIDPMVDNKTLTLIPSVGADSSIKWNWGWSSDFPVQFRPKS